MLAMQQLFHSPGALRSVFAHHLVRDALLAVCLLESADALRHTTVFGVASTVSILDGQLATSSRGALAARRTPSAERATRAARISESRRLPEAQTGRTRACAGAGLTVPREERAAHTLASSCTSMSMTTRGALVPQGGASLGLGSEGARGAKTGLRERLQRRRGGGGQHTCKQVRVRRQSSVRL